MGVIRHVTTSRESPFGTFIGSMEDDQENSLRSEMGRRRAIHRADGVSESQQGRGIVVTAEYVATLLFSPY